MKMHMNTDIDLRRLLRRFCNCHGSSVGDCCDLDDPAPDMQVTKTMFAGKNFHNANFQGKARASGLRHIAEGSFISDFVVMF